MPLSKPRDFWRGEPVYLVVAITAGDVLQLKPQNLVTGLPIQFGEMVN